MARACTSILAAMRGSRYMARHHDSDAHTAAARGPLWIAIGKAAAVYGSRQPDAIVPAL